LAATGEKRKEQVTGGNSYYLPLATCYIMHFSTKH
jgi:hypothetical protein